MGAYWVYLFSYLPTIDPNFLGHPSTLPETNMTQPLKNGGFASSASLFFDQGSILFRGELLVSGSVVV